MINIRLVLVCLFYFLGCYLWYEHSPFPDLHKWTYKMQAVYYILPLQVLFLFFFFRYHAWMAICFSLLPAWLFLLFIFCITKKRGKFPKKRIFYKAFVCALSAALVIPSLYIVGVIVFHVPKKQEKTTEENTSVFDDYRLLQYDEDAVYKENENQKLFSNFRQSHWELCSTQRKIELLQELADFEARENLHIPEVKVYGETLPETIGGRYRYGKNEIQINKQYLENASGEESVRIVLHELAHREQDYLLTHLNIDVDIAKNYYFKHIRQWKKETLNYIDSNGEYERYSGQTLERDAESFAEEEWEKIEPYIK